MKYLSTDDLHLIHKTHILPLQKNGYFDKHDKLPKCPVKQWDYIWDKHDMPRNFAVLDFIEWVKKYGITNGANRTLAITGENDPELEFITNYNIKEFMFPPHDMLVHHRQYLNVFDFFIFNQTLEHLFNPFVAIEMIHSYMKPGGYVYTTVPTINIPHMTPIHFGGYNPMGLTAMFLSAGFEVLEVGQWGNYDYIEKLFRKHQWPDASAGERGCSHNNEEKNVAQCWILARKPLE